MNKPHKYINDFLYFVFNPEYGGKRDTLLYCSGINIDRFLPITKGRHRPMSNPAIRGLQLVNLGVRSLALSNGATPVAVRGTNDCLGIGAPGSAWSTERLLIKNAPGSLPGRIINYCVIELLKKIDRAIILGADMPDKLLGPEELQVFLEGLCLKYGENLQREN